MPNSIQKQVNESLHDSYERTPTNYPTADVLNFGRYTGTTYTYHGGVQFTGLSAIKGTIITAATLELFFSHPSYTSPDVNIHCEDVDSPTDFTDTDNDIGTRALSAHYTYWHADDLGTGWKTTPDFKDAVQDIANRPGFDGTLCVLLIRVAGTGTHLAQASAYDVSTTLCAIINITYTVVGEVVLQGASAGIASVSGDLTVYASGPMRATQQIAEPVILPSIAQARASHEIAEPLIEGISQQARISQETGEALIEGTSEKARASQIIVEALIAPIVALRGEVNCVCVVTGEFAPDYEDIPIVEIRISEEWGAGSSLTLWTEYALKDRHINDIIDVDLGYYASEHSQEKILHDCFYGYVDLIEQVRAERPAAYRLDARDRLKLAQETMLVPKTLDDASPYKYKGKRASYIVRDLLEAAGLATQLDLDDPDFTFGTSVEVEFLLQSVQEALEEIGTLLQYEVYQSPDSWIHFVRLEPRPAEEPTIPVTLKEGDNLTGWRYEVSDENLRYRCVVFGKGGIKVDISRWSPHVPLSFPDDIFTAIISSEMIESEGQAVACATDFVERWNRLTRTVHFEAVGNARVHSGETLALTAGSFADEPAFVYSVDHRLGRGGYIIEGDLIVGHRWSGIMFYGTVTPAYTGTCTGRSNTDYQLHDANASWRQPKHEGSGDGEWEWNEVGAKRMWEVRLKPGAVDEQRKTILMNDSNDLFTDRGPGRPGDPGPGKISFNPRPEAGDPYEIWPVAHNPRVHDRAAIWETDWCNGADFEVMAGTGIGLKQTIQDTRVESGGGRAPELVFALPFKDLPDGMVLDKTTIYAIRVTVDD